MIKKKEKNKKETSKVFVAVLAIVSILGFAGIISQSWFGFELIFYIESLILLALGIGFIVEAEPKILFKKSKQQGLDKRNFSRLTTFIIGSLATIAGILSFPYVNVQHFIFLAIKGVISIIAIIFIAVQTWVVK
jgi:hypothetical protein